MCEKIDESSIKINYSYNNEDELVVRIDYIDQLGDKEWLWSCGVRDVLLFEILKELRKLNSKEEPSKKEGGYFFVDSPKELTEAIEKYVNGMREK
jgi:hypothetical protein